MYLINLITFSIWTTAADKIQSVEKKINEPKQNFFKNWTYLSDKQTKKTKQKLIK